jgi:DMSO/TMAO reductase YedYZ molybdopterin-dependent catalytic subunit
MISAVLAFSVANADSSEPFQHWFAAAMNRLEFLWCLQNHANGLFKPLRLLIKPRNKLEFGNATQMIAAQPFS